MSDDKKFELIDEKRVVNGVTVHRIRALRAGRYAAEGQLGGWLESERNLSHDGDAWVSSEAVVMNGARVREGAWVTDHAMLAERAWVSDRVSVHDGAVVTDRTHLYGDVYVGGRAWLGDQCSMSGSASVVGNVRVSGTVHVTDYVDIEDDAQVTGGGYTLSGSVKIGRGATIAAADEVIGITGLLLEPITLYRAAEVDGQHRLRVGCQRFRLDRPVAELEALAERHCLPLTPGWRSLRNALLVLVRAWGNRAWDQDA